MLGSISFVLIVYSQQLDSYSHIACSFCFIQVFRKVGKIRTVTIARKKDMQHSGRHIESVVGRHTESVVGRHTESVVGRHTESVVGRHTESVLGRHTESVVG